MLRCRYYIVFTIFLAFLAASGFHQISYGQTPGTIKSHQKVSDTDGSFTGALDNSDQFGQSVANLGDLNGDGTPDLAVGARDDDDGGNARGAVWVLFLNTDGTVNSHQKISDTVGGFTGTLDDGDQFGFDLTSPGDIDGDGVADLVAGVPGDDDGGNARGAVWVLFLNTDGTVKAHQKISDTDGNFAGTLGNDNFGSAVASPGDLDSDGVVDLAVGSPFDDDGNNDRGAVWVLFMNSNGTVKSHQKISDITGSFTGLLDDSDQFGHAVASIGDLNSDGVTDLAVGARDDDDGGNARGAVWVLFMNSDGTVKSHQKISDTDGNFTGTLDDGDIFGFDVASAGDLDGDSITDLVVGAAGDDDGGNARGAVWALFMNSDGTVKSHQKISDTGGNFTGALSDNDNFGSAVTSLGDIDNDNFPDLAVGAPFDDDGGSDRGAVWVLTLNGQEPATGTITTVAGKTTGANGGFSGNGGPAVQAELSFPIDVSIDENDHIYLAENSNHRIRRIDAATGIITTIAGSGPTGPGNGGFSGDGGPATQALLNIPNGLFVDSGNVYFSDTGNSRIRKVDLSTGIITTVAGNGTSGFGGDGGPATQANLSNPFGLFVRDDNLYIGDLNNSRIRKVDLSTGIITTVAGNGTSGFGGDGGPATQASLNGTIDVFVDAAGAIYIVDQNNHRIRKVDTNGIINTVAGDGTFGQGTFSDGGLATQSSIWSPKSILVDADGNLFISDSSNERVRKVDTNGIISTVAGNGTSSTSGDGGPATQAGVRSPFGLAVDASGDLYIASVNDHRVRKVTGITTPAAPPSSTPVDLSISSAFAAPGDTVKLDFKLDNSSSSAVGGLQARIYLGDMTKATFTGLADTLMGNAGGFTVTTTVVGDTLRVVVFSTDNSALNTGVHLLGRLCFALINNNTHLGGDVAVTVDDNTLEIGDDQGQLLTDETTDGAIQIGVRGDVNLDARVSILDVIKLVRIIIGSDPSPAAGSTAFAIADMNEDGELNITDVVVQINNILGIVPKAVASSPTQPVTVSLDALRTLPDGRSVLPVTLGTDGLIAGTQLAFSFDPALVEIGAPQPAGAAENLGFDYHIEDGTLRLVIYGLQPGTGISAGNNAVLFLPVTLLGNAAASPSVTLTEALLVDAQAQTVPVQLGVITQPVSGRNAAIPSAFSLGEATPNPFNPSTVISYDVPQQAQVTLTVYNLLGQEVVRLVDQVQAAGRYQVTWHAVNSQGASVASGVYLYRLTSDTGHSESRRMTLLK